MDVLSRTVGFDAPDLAPVLLVEKQAHGWRGLTGDGEILNVAAANGRPVEIPESISVMRNGAAIGYRAVPKELSDPGIIDRYEMFLRSSATALRANQLTTALEYIEKAIVIAPTAAARLNRAMILLAMGRWQDGFADFVYAEQSPLFMRPKYRDAIGRGLTPWDGQDIVGKSLVLLSDHGFGDAIMMLRFMPQLQAMGADVWLHAPPELQSLATQLTTVTYEIGTPDYVCSLFHLLHVLKIEPVQMASAPYLHPSPWRVEHWKKALGHSDRKRIGVAWSVGVQHKGDYPRTIPLALLCQHLGDAELISVQQQGRAEADLYGVRNFGFSDFNDCAALMTCLDEIVTIDTAAAHLAGAIGHPSVTLLLSHWHSWRWQAPLYEGVTICRQDSVDDWTSALAKRLR